MDARVKPGHDGAIVLLTRSAKLPIDVHAHYVPPQLIAAIKSKGSVIGVKLTPADAGKETLGFDYGFKVRPFFPRLIEPVTERHKWMDEQGIDHQIVGTWPDIFGYGLPREQCIQSGSIVRQVDNLELVHVWRAVVIIVGVAFKEGV